MPTTIKLKNSVTTTNAPSSLAQGEVAINVTDKKVWVGNAATTPVQLLGGGADGSFTNISVSSVATFGAGSVSAPAITTTGDTNTGIFFPAADTIAFTEGGAEAMRIDSSGNVGIGTSSPNAVLGLARGAGVSAMIEIAGNGNTTGTSSMLVGQDGGSSGYCWNRATGAALLFGTNNTERMRIDSSGKLLVGASATSSFFDGTVNIAGGLFTKATSTNYFWQTGTSGTRTYLTFITGSTPTQTGAITTDGTLTIYGTTSDYRLKTIVSSVSDAGARIDALEPIEYDWNNGAGRTRGFLAHKFAEVYPNSVSGEKDAIDAEGKAVYQSMQASSSEVMADLIAEIQSLRKRVLALENK